MKIKNTFVPQTNDAVLITTATKETKMTKKIPAKKSVAKKSVVKKTAKPVAKKKTSAEDRQARRVARWTARVEKLEARNAQAEAKMKLRAGKIADLKKRIAAKK